MRREAERGAAFLDGALPFWWNHVDTNSLNMESARGCVVGQAGEYAWFAQIERWSGHEPNGDDNSPGNRWAIRRGFLLTNSDNYNQLVTRYGKLTEIWRELIKQRRGAAAS